MSDSGLKDMAIQMGIAETTFRDAVKSLESKNLIVCEKGQVSGKSQVKSISLDLDKFVEVAAI
jgi:DNA-binding FadR family transcriptional regulator